MVFSAQVLQRPLDEALPEHRSREILSDLGVDTDSTRDPVGRQQLMRDRLGRFLRSIGELKPSRDKLMKDTNLELGTRKQAEDGVR